MTDYIVDSTGAGDFATLTAASKAVKPGDRVIVKRGTYRETLTADVSNVTWKAVDNPYIDGGWRGGTSGTGWTALIAITAPGCTVSGFNAANSYGRGVVISASDTTLEECYIENTYQGGLLVGNSAGPTISNVTVRDCLFTRMSQSWVTEKNPKGVNGSVNIHNVVDSLFERNTVTDGWGEGVNLGRNSQRVIVRDNEIHSCNHVLAYINRAQYCVIEDNKIYHIPDPQYGGRKADSYSAGVVIGDEVSAVMARFDNSRGNVIRGNVVVNVGKLLQVRNNATADGYDTTLVDTVIENNTFVAGPVTETGIDIQSNRRGRSHSGSTFRHNVVYFDNASSGDIGTYTGSGVTFGRNAWSSPPPQAMRAADDIQGDMMLYDPEVDIARFDEWVTDFWVDNYRPNAGSPLVTGPTVGALDTLVIPDPEPVCEVGAIIADAETVRAQLATISMAADDALANIDKIIAALNDVAQA